VGGGLGGVSGRAAQVGLGDAGRGDAGIVVSGRQRGDDGDLRLGGDQRQTRAASGLNPGIGQRGSDTGGRRRHDIRALRDQRGAVGGGLRLRAAGGGDGLFGVLNIEGALGGLLGLLGVERGGDA